MGHNYVGTEHLLLGLVKEGEGVAAQVLVSLGADLGKVRQQVINMLGSGGGQTPGGNGQGCPAGGCKTVSLDQFSRDLTRLAKEEKLDPVVGRAKEIERVIQVLSAVQRLTLL